jgi:hypothetical protein
VRLGVVFKGCYTCLQSCSGEGMNSDPVENVLRF